MNFTVNLIGFVVSLIALALSFSVIWQSEKGLDKAFKIFSVALAVLVAKELMQLLDALGTPKFAPYQEYFSIVGLLLIVMFLYRFHRTINEVYRRKR